MKLPVIRCMEDMENLVMEIGMLPFFRNPVEGFSVEEAVAPGLWFAEGVDGPWEWKGPVARRKKCVYGKFFKNKTGFVRTDLFMPFANYRRRGYDFEGRCDEGLASRSEMKLMRLLGEHPSLNTRQLKALGGFGRGGAKGFESAIVSLQMQTFAVVEDFEYAVNARGEPYGWGIARYATPEALLGSAFNESLYDEEPEESLARLTAHLTGALGSESAARLAALLQTRRP